MVKASLSLLILFLFCTPLWAQQDCDQIINGQVLDRDTNEPLPFATVKIQNSNNGVVSDENGRFSLENICDVEVHLEVRFVGYKSIIHHHDTHHNDPTIYLAPEKTELESIIIEESRTKQLQTISIQKKEIDDLAIVSSSLGDLTEDLSGVSTLKTGTNISKPIIHGLHSNRVLVVNDGLRHAYQVWGLEHAPEIDPSHVDQIEIVKGAATVKYGPEALGGVILYNSKRPAFDEKIGGALSSSYQTNGRAYTSKFDLGQGFHRFAWNVGAFGTYQADLEAPDYTLSNTGKRELGGSFNALLHQKRFDLQVSGSYFEQELGFLRASIVGNLDDLQNAIDRGTPIPTFPATYSLQNPKQNTKHGLIKSDLSVFLGEHILKLQYGYQENIRREFDVRRGELNDRPVIDLNLISHTFEAEWIQPAIGRWSGSTGFQYFTQNSVNEPESNPVNFVPDYDVTNMGAYTVQSYDLDQTTIELGIRVDFQTLSVADTIRDRFTYANEVDFTNATFSLGMRKQINESLTVFTNIGSAWRPPNVAELYAFGYHFSRIQFGFWRYDFNPNIYTPVDSVFDQSLRPVASEKSLKWVTGLEMKRPRTTAELIFYANRINDYIFIRPHGVTINVAGTFPYFLYDQTDALFLGADLDVRFKHTEEFTSEAKVSYVYGVETSTNSPFLEIPPFNVNYTLDYKKGPWNYGVNLNFTAQQWNAPPVIEPKDLSSGETDIDPNNDIFDFMAPPEAFVLIGGNIGYQRKHWGVAASVNNLLNTSYRLYTDRLRYFADAPGRNFSLSASFKF